jgi:hypothetical protein
MDGFSTVIIVLIPLAMLIFAWPFIAVIAFAIRTHCSIPTATNTRQALTCGGMSFLGSSRGGVCDVGH